MADIPVLRPKGIPTIFGDLKEDSITFLIDTSGSMFLYLDVVKEHLIEVLLSRSFKQNDTLFNIMEFSSEVVPWADRMVKCTPQTVTVASEWVKKLGCKTGTNTLDALLAGFLDPSCEALYLVTDGLPDQMPEEILKHVALASEDRPVHAIYLAGGIADVPACDFLTNLARNTGGTFHSISISNRGSIEEVRVVVRTDHAAEISPSSSPTTLDNPPMRNIKVYDSSFRVPATSIQTTLRNLPKSNTVTYVTDDDGITTKTCSVTTSVDHSPITRKLISVDDIPTRVVRTDGVLLHYPDLTWETYRPTANLVRRMLANADKSSVTGGVLLQGMRVLARRDKDGFYCLGFIKQQVTANHTFLVEFDKEPSSKVQPHLQETAIYDIISYNDASRHSIAAGDKVLAPHGKLQYRFAPGTVLEGLEGRSSGCAADTESLVVSLFDGKTEQILKQTAIWIPSQLYERIKLEIQMPITARQYLINNPHYPIMVPPGYDTRTGIETGYLAKTGTTALQGTGYLLGGYDGMGFEPTKNFPVYVPVYPGDPAAYGFRVPAVRDSAVKSDDVNRLIPGTSLTKEDLNRKVMQQLLDNKMITRMSGDQIEQEASPLRSGNLRKSVSFRREDVEMDSGIDSYAASFGRANFESLSEPKSEDEDDGFIETATQTLSLKDSGIGTDYSLLYNHRPDFSSDERPPWQYWNPNSQSSYRKGLKFKPFRDTVLSAPAEAKVQPILAEPITAFSPSKQEALLDAIEQDIKTDRAQLEWIQRHPHPPLRPPYDPEIDKGTVNRSGAFKTVDHTVKSDQAHLEWIKKHPHPPNGIVYKQREIPAHRKINSRDMVREAKEKAYLEYRRNQVMQMEAHYSQLEEDARQMKEAKENRFSASLAIEESLTLRYDASNLTQTKNTNASESFKIIPPSNAEIRNTQRKIQFQNPQSTWPPKQRPENLTVRDVVFSERKTLTPPPIKHTNLNKFSPENSDSPRGKILTNPYITNRSYSFAPKSNMELVETANRSELVNFGEQSEYPYLPAGVKSLQEMSNLQQCSKSGQKKLVRVTGCANTGKTSNKELQNALVAFLEENPGVGRLTNDMIHSMHDMLLHSSEYPKPAPPNKAIKPQKGKAIRKSHKIVQNSKELHQNHITMIATQNGQLQQERVFSAIPTQREAIQMVTHQNSSTTHEHSSSVTHTQKQMLSEHTLTQKSLGNKLGGSHKIRLVESSQECTEAKSAVQMTSEMKAKIAASAIPKLLPHQKFAADVTRHDVQRQRDSEDKLQRIHEAKRSVSSSIAQRQQEHSNREAEREAARVEALRKRGQRREEIASQREKEIQDTVKRRQEIKQQKQDELTRCHIQNLTEQNEQAAARETQQRNAEIQRRDFFYKKELKNQEAKDLRLAVREQKHHDLRSQVLP